MASQAGIVKLAHLIDTVVAPKQGERMLFLTDFGEKSDDQAKQRMDLVLRWHQASQLLSKEKSFRLLPIVVYKETGKNNSELPKSAETIDGGHVDDLPSLIASCNIAIAMTKYSASAPLKNLASSASSLRAVSMPGVSADMEKAMYADYARIDLRARKLLPILQSAQGFEVIFDGAGIPHKTLLYVDTRAGGWIVDSGKCHQKGDFINFPSGEIFAPPYEGVSAEGRLRFGDSQTHGIWPIYSHLDGKVSFLKVEKNRIIRVQGDSYEADRIIQDLSADENAANIAEIGFGLNENARAGPEVPVLEREKAGPHLAYGRNDHFGAKNSLSGKVRASMHVDYVYTSETPITATVFAVFPNGNRALIAQRGKVVAV